MLSQVVQVCAEHKKPKKLLKHMMTIKAQSAGQRNPPRTLVFANRVRAVISAGPLSPDANDLLETADTCA